MRYVLFGGGTGHSLAATVKNLEKHSHLESRAEQTHSQSRSASVCRGSTQLQHTGHLGITAIQYSPAKSVVRRRRRGCARRSGGGGRKAHVVPWQAKKAHVVRVSDWWTCACFSRRNTTQSRRFGTSSSSFSSRAAHSSKQGATLLSAFFMGALPTSLPVRANSAWQLCPRCVLSHLNKKKHQSRLVGEQSERERRKLAKTPANSFSTPLQLTTCAFFHRPKDTLRAARYAGGRPLMVLYAACRSKATR